MCKLEHIILDNFDKTFGYFWYLVYRILQVLNVSENVSTVSIDFALEHKVSNFPDCKSTYPCTGEATQARTSLYMVTYHKLHIHFPFSCHRAANDVFLTMVFQAFWALTIVPNGNTDVVEWQSYKKNDLSVHCNVHRKLW